MPCNICGCIYHGNIALLLEELYRKFPENFRLYGEEFVKSCVCNTTNKKCLTSNCVLYKTKFQTTYLDGIKEKHLRAAATWYQWEKGEGSQRKMKRKAPWKICCQLFKTCSKSFCCITLLTNCKRKHIMHADWLQQQQIATSDGANGFLWKFLLCLSAWIFQCPLENKQCHTVHCHDLFQGTKYINGPFVR